MSVERLLEPFTFPFMVDAMVAACVVGIACAVLSCYLVLKGWSLMGDAVSHAVLPGIVLAYLAGVPLAIGAFVSGLGCALLTGFIRANARLKEDTVMGVVFTGLFAIGLVMFSKIRTDLHLDHILFGNVLGIERRDFLELIVVSGVMLCVVTVQGRDLLLFCFDAGHAKSIGLRTGWLNYLLLSLLAATIVVSLKAVGIILVIAMLITPGATGLLLADRWRGVMAVAVAGAAFSSFLGVYVSFFANVSPAASIVLVQSGLFLCALLFSSKHGLLRPRGLDSVVSAK